MRIKYYLTRLLIHVCLLLGIRFSVEPINCLPFDSNIEKECIIIPLLINSAIFVELVQPT